MESVYIHIPFCSSICSYCDFCKLLYNPKWVDKYLQMLKVEIEDKYNDELISTIYIGGGTPSALTLEELEKLFDIIKMFKTSSDVEITFECNINDLREELLCLLKKNKVNRLSIGIESFDKEALLYMNRSQTFEEALKSITLARKIGFGNINVDLIYALPVENLKTIKKDIRQILRLKPNHISAYSLIIEPNTVISVDEPINEDIEVKMYEHIKNTLRNKGYEQYEISNYALNGYESKHNLNYWHNKEYFGFGLGSHGYIYGVRYENTRSMTEYLKGNFIAVKNILSKAETMENEIMLGLRTREGINIKEFFLKYNVNIQDVFPIKPLLKSKELIYKNGYISISENKMYLMNEILLKLL